METDGVEGRMNRTGLQRKVTFSLLSVFAFMYLAYYLAFRLIVLRSFEDMEVEHAGETSRRIQASITGAIENLSRFAHDWSSWDDSYEYMKNKNPEYEASNFTVNVYQDQHLYVLAMYDAGREAIWSRSLDAESEVLQPFDLKQAVSSPAMWNWIFEKALSGQPVAGVVNLAAGPLILAARPVLKSSGEGPVQGVFVMGRLIDKDMIERWRRQAGVEFRVSIPSPDEAAGRWTGGVQQHTSGDTIRASFAYAGPDGNPALHIEADLPREIMAKGLRVYYLGSVVLFALFVVSVIVTSALLRKTVIQPVQDLTRAVSRAKTTGDAESLPKPEQEDEIGTLGRVFRDTLLELDARNRTFNAIGESARDLIVMIDDHGIVTYWSNAGASMLGHEANEVVGKAIHSVLAPARYHHDFQRAFPAFQVSGEGRMVGQTLELTALHRDGREIPVELSLSSVRLQERWHAVGIIRDITERNAANSEQVRLQDQLRQSQKLESIGRLAGGVAHDFNNLLTCIMGNTELAMGEMSPADPLYADLADVYGAAKRAATLTSQLLAFSRKQVIAPRVVNLNDLLSDATRMIIRLIGEDIELVFAPFADLGSVKIDPHQMEQVLVNLAVNARDAMPRGGRLTIETSNESVDEGYSLKDVEAEPGEYVRLTVSDTGCGIEPELMEHIFEPFFTTKETGKGTGLGLAMVYGAVKQNQGFIRVYSEVGVGTVVKIFIPRFEGKSEDITLHEVPTLPTGVETILLVEDEDVVRGFARKILVRQGYQVVAVENGEKALEWVEGPDSRFDLLVTDVIMPAMDGYELYERLRLSRPDLRVLYMSGYTEDIIARHGVLDGKLEFVQKPFTATKLARKVREALDRRA